MTRFQPTSLLLCLLALPVLPGCQGRSGSTAAAAGTEPESLAPVARVEVIRPERKTIRRVVEQPAQIKAYEETPLYAKVAGYVQQMNVDIGDRLTGPRRDAQGKQIAAGQPVVVLWIPELEDDLRQKAALVTQAKAGLEQSRAAVRLAEAAIVTAQAAVAQAEAGIKRAEASHAKWESEFGRIVELAAHAAITEKLVDETRNQVAAADADRQEAQAKRESALALVVESKATLEKARADLTAAEARVQVAQADHAKAATLVEYGILRAPFDGVVTKRNAHTGHLVQPGPQGEPLLVVMRTDILRVLIDVPESDAALTQPGNPVSIRVPALPGDPLNLKIARTAGTLDVATRTLRAEVDLPNANGRIATGLYAYATIVMAEHRDALVLPASAVLTEKGQSNCLCVVDGKIVRQPIELGLRSKNEVEIASGLKGDDAVVRVNSTAFADGQPVAAVPYVPPKP